MTSPTELWSTTALAFTAGGALVAGLNRLLRTKPENEALAVTTLRGVLAELRAELEYRERQVKSLRHRLDLAEAQIEALAAEPPPHLA